MATEIKCPSCGHQFEPNESIREEIEKELRSKAAEWQKKKNEEFQVKLDDEKKKLQQSLEENIRKNITGDFENKLRLLEQNNKDNEEKLKLSRQKELAFLKKEQEVLNKEKEIDLQLQRLLLEERSKLSEIIRKEETDRTAIKETEYQMKLKEKDEKIEAIQRKTEEMQKRIEQGSMQTQGEVQELLLEELLKTSFPFDIITEVGKGVRGADCIQIVRNNLGQECGKIIFESKRTKDFSNDWIEKLKVDRRNQGADIGVIVTQTLPKDMSSFGEKDNVWICTFTEVKAVVYMLRDGIIKVSGALKSQENKGEKMNMLYEFLTGNEFRGQIEAIVEGFVAMKQSISKERIQMEKNWKEREKQVDKVLINTSGMYGSIKGIAGSSINNIPLLEGDIDEPSENFD
jgi:hypothetical protein